MSSISGIGGAGSTSGAWTSATRAQQQQRMFAKADTNGDGSIDVDELQGILDHAAKATGSTETLKASDVFAKLDTDGNGTLSEQELAQGMQSILPPPDTVDFAKSRAVPDSGSDAGEAQGTDATDATDSGGKHVHGHHGHGGHGGAEAAGGGSTDAIDALFGRIDTDGDGTLSASESKSFIDQLSSALQAASTSTASSSTTSSSTASTTGTQTDGQDGNSLIELARQAYQEIAAMAGSLQAAGASLDATA